MIFRQKHTIIVNKPIELVRENLHAKSSKENIKALDDTQFRGYKRINAWKSTAIISEIKIDSQSANETQIEIKNEFDLSTRFSFWVLALFIFFVGIYKVSDLAVLHGLEISLLGVGPFVVMLIGYSSFSSYDASTIQFYRSILESTSPN
jgi:hypothetical protein